MMQANYVAARILPFLYFELVCQTSVLLCKEKKRMYSVLDMSFQSQGMNEWEKKKKI